MSGGSAALRARREELARRAEAERDRLAGQFDDWSGGWTRATSGLGFFGAVGRHLPVRAIGVVLGLAAVAFVRAPALRTAVVAMPVAWRLGRGIVRVVSSFRR